MDTLVDISIIVPVYKIREEDLRACIESLINQTYENIEILLVDDGSPDQCGTVCDEYAQTDKRIRVIHQPNRGVSAARNAGIRTSVGTYIMFVDADDWLELDCCERMLSEIREHDVNFVFFRHCIEDRRGTKYLPKAESKYLSKEMLKNMQLNSLKARRYHYGFDDAPPWGKIIRGDFIKENNLRYTEGIRKSQDVLFNLYLYELVDSSYFVDYTGYHYKINEYSINRRYNPEMPQISLEMLAATKEYVLKHHPDDVLYEKALGVRSLVMLGAIERTYYFHEDSTLTRDEIIDSVKQYMDNVSKYIVHCTIGDFPTIKSKVRFFLIRNRLFLLYYYVLWFARRFLKAI